MRNMAVVMTAYQRPEYMERTLESWACVRWMEGLALRRACIELTPMQEELAQLAMGYEWQAFMNHTKYGVLVNPVESISRVFCENPEVGFVILAEDDVVVSSDVLEYFSWASEAFQYDQSVWTVCAHRPQGTVVVGQQRPEAVVKSLGFSCPLVWGTWRDRWDSFIYPTWDRDYRNRGWDWNLVMLMKASGKHSVFPEQNRSDHIGENGGAHCTPAMFPETVDPAFRADVGPCAYRLVEGPALW